MNKIYSKKLEESCKAVKILSNKLNARKAQKDEWLWECVPLTISDQMRRLNYYVPARILFQIILQNFFLLLKKF